MENKQISRKVSVFNGRMAPEESLLVGYGAIIEKLKLPLPFPKILTLISSKKRIYTTEEWRVLSSKYAPKETLYDHLVFALKYEGLDLLFFKKLFENVQPHEIENWIINEPLSQYGRRIWFLYELMMVKQLEVPDLKNGNYVLLVDEKQQYASSVSINSNRHRIKNNLPGTVDFCPLIFKTAKLEKYIQENLAEKTNSVISGIHKDILLRTSAFLLLKDSKASFTIEGEIPTQNRAVRWGRAIGQAGSKSLTKDELLRLQQILIENSRFLKMGYRTEGGFVGTHDRSTGEPIPEHISARYQDIEKLMEGLLFASEKMEKSQFHPVLTTSIAAFGFVFIHPLADGNGRLHRYLIHHLLAKMKFTPQGIIFPVSSAILERIADYRKVLESYSLSLLDFIEWKKTVDNNVEVFNDTFDYYRYFDATAHAEFLFECIDYTINKIIPDEVAYLQNYDRMKAWLDDRFQMPDKMVDLLIRFLEQNKGKFSERSKGKEFSALTDSEVKDIESNFKAIMGNID